MATRGNRQLLDELSHRDSGPRPKPSVQSGDVEESIRHLSHQDLEAYASGRLASAQLNDCQTHLDSCDECRAELEDLRTLKGDLSGVPRSGPNRPGPERRKRGHRLSLPLVASGTAIFVAAGSAFLWWGQEGSRAKRTSPAVSVVQSPASPSAAAKQTHDTRVTDAIAALPEDVRSAVSEAIQHGSLLPLTDMSRSPEHAATLPGTRKANTRFALLSPFGEAITEGRPEFSWQPLAGAVRYTVTIVDEGLRPVRRSAELRATFWRPGRPLRSGHTYLWQVTATLRNGSKVVASEPSPSQTFLRIVPVKLADEIAHFQQDHQGAHLVLGALYAQAGMLTESAEEFRKVPPEDLSYKTAQALLASLPTSYRYDPPRQLQ
jgi:hypothetical protein